MTFITSEPVRVQLIKSYCLPLLVYCIGALRLKRPAVHQLSVCWNDASVVCPLENVQICTYTINVM